MIGNVKTLNTENQAGDVNHRRAKDRAVSTDDTGFLSILRESVIPDNHAVQVNDNSTAAGNVSRPEIKSENDTVAEPVHNPHNGNDYSFTAENRTDSAAMKHENVKNDPANESRAGNRQTESNTARTDAREKTEETKGSLKNKKAETDAGTHINGESLMRKAAENIRLHQKSDIRDAGEKLNSKSVSNNDRGTLSRILYPREARHANLHNLQQEKISADSVKNSPRDLPEAAGKELGRNIQARRKPEELKTLSSGTSREAGPPVLAALKKEKPGAERTGSARHVSPDEIRNEKKQSGLPENMQVKHKDTGGESFTGKGTGGGADHGQRETGLQNGFKIETSGRAGKERTDQMKNMPEFRQSLQEIMDKAKVTVQDSRNGSFTVKLFPKDLGNVNVNLVLENGVVNGKFLVENNEAKSLLLSSLDNLKDELARSGVSVGEFSVNVRDERERFFREKDEKTGAGHLLKTGSETVAAAVVYDSNALSMHNGSINMII